MKITKWPFKNGRFSVGFAELLIKVGHGKSISHATWEWDFAWGRILCNAPVGEGFHGNDGGFFKRFRPGQVF